MNSNFRQSFECVFHFFADLLPHDPLYMNSKMSQLYLPVFGRTIFSVSHFRSRFRHTFVPYSGRSFCYFDYCSSPFIDVLLSMFCSGLKAVAVPALFRLQAELHSNFRQLFGRIFHFPADLYSGNRCFLIGIPRFFRLIQALRPFCPLEISAAVRSGFGQVFIPD